MCFPFLGSTTDVHASSREHHGHTSLSWGNLWTYMPLHGSTAAIHASSVEHHGQTGLSWGAPRMASFSWEHHIHTSVSWGASCMYIPLLGSPVYIHPSLSCQRVTSPWHEICIMVLIILSLNQYFQSYFTQNPIG